MYPQVLWLKRHLPEQYARVSRFYDLSDYLVYRATGNTDARGVCALVFASDLPGPPCISLHLPHISPAGVCALVCKWNFLAHNKDKAGQWPVQLMTDLGLEDAIEDPSLIGVGPSPIDVGCSTGNLTAGAAEELGLSSGCTVSSGVIDAHCGAVGCIGCTGDPLRTLAVIGGTSACHMALSEAPRFVPGIWGPYFGAVVPQLWLNEAGQSAAGSVIDYTIRSSTFWPELQVMMRDASMSEYELLNQAVIKLESEAGGCAGSITRGFHMLGDHHGNRSPRADPSLRGMESGLDLNTSISGLAIRYLAALQAVAYGARHIIEALCSSGYQIDAIAMCGGGTKNPLFIREHANICGRAVVLSSEPEAVLLGGAVLAATAAGAYDSLPTAMQGMCRPGAVVQPEQSTEGYHERKYLVWKEMYEDQMKYRQMMSEQ